MSWAQLRHQKLQLLACCRLTVVYRREGGVCRRPRRRTLRVTREIDSFVHSGIIEQDKILI